MPKLTSQRLEPYEIDPDVLAEIDQQMANDRLVFIHAEDSLTDVGKRTGIFDVAMQCALGNREKVLTAEVDAICRATREAVKVRMYFVEKSQYEAARREREIRRRQRMAAQTRPTL